jgi:hypothetical protein
MRRSNSKGGWLSTTKHIHEDQNLNKYWVSPILGTTSRKRRASYQYIDYTAREIHLLRTADFASLSHVLSVDPCNSGDTLVGSSGTALSLADGAT